MNPKNKLNNLVKQLHGELHHDALHKAIYATDASVYRELPTAVSFPKDIYDLKLLIDFARKENTSLIPRTAGTSLAGQCVGEGIVVDVSKYFTNILELDEQNKTVTVQPGVIRDELNQYLKTYGLFFGPNTSTANRCMIGGMVGNNSSGTTSIKYGVTRDKVLELEVLLSDGSEVVFKPLLPEEFKEKLELHSLEGEVYRTVFDLLNDQKNQQTIKSEFPKPEIHRRNTGYAVDELLRLLPFNKNGGKFNMCSLLVGSEGTLAFTTKIKLKLDPLPPQHNVMVAAHFKSVSEACKAVVPVMNHGLYTCEMMDKVILDCTKNNKSQVANRFFIEGDPEAILMLELADNDLEKLEVQRRKLIETLEKTTSSYAHPSLYKEDIDKALELRKAGLGLLGNIVGDHKAVACIEDTAVAIEDLSDYIDEFAQIMQKYNQKAVYYAHAGAGELHLRPILDLKTSEGVHLFRAITTDVAVLVKKYKGSMSGEHGDGRVRSEFIKLMIGEANYNLLEQVKTAFDPENIFNPGKIVNYVAMDESLRYEKDRQEPHIETLMDFSDSEGILRAAEKCNGSGDCRKTHHANGAMCPSYHATKNEKDTTRARANALREFLTNSDNKNRFSHKELKEVFDLCLSCKACGSECPSNVDIASLKAEFLYQYQSENGTTLRDKAFAYNTKLNKLGSRLPFLINNPISRKIVKSILGVAPERSLPEISSYNFDRHLQSAKNKNITNRKVLLYIDEFTEFLDIELGKDAIDLLQALGYEVELYYGESGRTFISKGFLAQAKKIAKTNLTRLNKLVDDGCPLIGLEPSAILSFRDEYHRLLPNDANVKRVAENAYLIEEFLAGEIKDGKINSSMFTKENKEIKIHGHCHQKALSNQKVTFDILNLPDNFKVSIINSGCCGMAGSFGYEKEHYEVSMKVGSQRLFPAIEKTAPETIIAANGTSCRHQIYDGTKRTAKHPVTILKEALI
ncbi:FAD/FMN-containing dehydrogenase [Zhouia amylolytica]|uniref:FAD/FMN-containing dehydrogenase n=1 Tax=Zhouia amylolytica TaxID=376730 RepID=A0A1I6UKM6_9FLAO|nr:FAD-binding and (Fe-S)-binding domain-containing protein [Zhouia amylolytica]MCQ0112708.1 FAD-binding protein [Zhouia amylolytica]SFT01914.1 FAD/FMN-containing dehydrogenase [Zhouia amylolytica]